MLNVDFVSHLYHNTLKLLPFKQLRKSSKITQTSLDIAGILQKSLENHGKSSEVIGTLSKIKVMTRQKSHTHLTQKNLAGILPLPLLYSYPLLCINNVQGKENKEQSFAAVLLVGGPWQLIFAIWATRKS